MVDENLNLGFRDAAKPDEAHRVNLIFASHIITPTI